MAEASFVAPCRHIRSQRYIDNDKAGVKTQFNSVWLVRELIIVRRGQNVITSPGRVCVLTCLPKLCKKPPAECYGTE